MSAQKPKSKRSTPRSLTAAPSNLLPDVMPSESMGVTARPSAKTTLADWTAEGQDDDVNGFYGGEKRQRGGRKRRKKNKEESHAPQNWDDIYDPCRPNNYEDYKHSDEKILEVKEWKDKLYAHRLARHSESDSSDNEYRPQLNSVFLQPFTPVDAKMMLGQFAPPSSSFVPAPSFDYGGSLESDPHLVEVPNDPISDSFPARRMRQIAAEPLNHEPIAQHSDRLSISPPPPVLPPAFDPPSQLNSQPSLGSISQEPVRYNLLAPPSGLPTSKVELEEALRTEFKKESLVDGAPRSLRPGQRGFAERLMSKYGWSKGSGLGASGSGIVNPLRVQIEKQKKKLESEGGGFAGPGGRGKIIGGQKKSGPETGPENSKFGIMSEVVVLQGMVDGLDLDAELEGAGDGGLMQEIGEECGDKVSRLKDRSLFAHLLTMTVWPCGESFH